MKRFPKGGIRKNAQEFVDADYLSKLTSKEREWYDNFIKAEYGANRQSAEKIKGAKLTKAEVKRLDKINNARRADAYNRLDRTTGAQKALANLEKIEDES